MKRPRFPVVVLVVGFGFSLAANTLWCWPGGPVRVLGGALASVALPAAIHMWSHVPVPDRASRALRLVVMSAIAGLAAVTTFEHSSRLLLLHGEDLWLARAYPVMSELLVVFAVLAWRTPVRVKPARARGTTARPAHTTPPDRPARRRGDLREQAELWLAARPVEPYMVEVRALMSQFGCSQTYAKRIRTAVRGSGVTA